uniref:Uncharacterized protein n=1 Tax=Loxodonta africana TaxID=9785 RepID=G3UGM8_LOXAF
MLFGPRCQRERLCKSLYVVQIFLLAGAMYYYFLESVGKTDTDHELAGEPSQLIQETIRPVWGLMDKCYPVTTQRRTAKSGKKEVSETMTPRAQGGLNHAAHKQEGEPWTQEEGVRSPGEGVASPIVLAKKEVKEEEEVAETPSWEEMKKVQNEAAVDPSEKPEVEGKVERSRGWVPLLRKLWLGWFPASKTYNHK